MISNARNPRARRWFGTIPNPSDETISKLNDFLQNSKYAIWCKERAPTTGMLHIHFYMHSRTLIYLNTIKATLGSGRYEIARGSEYDNIKYISKDGDIIEYGEPTLNTVNERAKEEKLKKMLEDVVKMNWGDFESQYTVQAFNQKNKLLQWKYEHQKAIGPWNGTLASKNLWLWGKPGTGKSRWPHQQCDPEKTYIKNVNKWWDGYDDTKIRLVIIEDFPVDNKDWLINILKIWSDRYQFNGEIKGGTTRVTPGKWILIITSNHSIDQVFDNSSDDDRNAIKRRFSEIQMERDSIVPWTSVPIDQLQ